MKRKADSATVPTTVEAGSKKRKLAEPEDFIPLTTEDKAHKKAKKDKKEKKKDKSDKKEKKEKSKDKKEKKEKKPKVEEAAEEAVEEEQQQAASKVQDEPEAKKSKKDKKEKKSKKDKTMKNSATAAESTETKAEAKDESEAVNGAGEEEPGKREKYIVFIGNLPYSATADTIRAHFASVKPTAVRLLTQRDNPSKSRGIAFIEFGTYGHMKSCLEHFHHSEFSDGVSPARKINVELTAGGGGKKEARQEKIKQKNKSLDEERAKRLAKEEAAKKEKEAEKRPKPESQEDMIHPSRRGQVPKGRR